MNGSSRVMLVVAVSTLSLAACGKSGDGAPSSAAVADAGQAASPLAAIQLSDVSRPMNAAPGANQLPAAPRARVARLARTSKTYAYADQGYAMNRAFGDAPPDYAVDYNGVRPWVWRGDNDAMRVVEPTPDGNRYYYYETGSDYPYLVRDNDYSYGYQNGLLVVVYDSRGRTMPPQYVDQRADMAGRYLARAREIYAAAQRQQRQAVASANWRARRDALAAERDQWARGADQVPDWRDYHAQHDPQDQARWDQERYRREAQAARIAQTENDQADAQRHWQAAQQTQAYQRQSQSRGAVQQAQGHEPQTLAGPGRGPEQTRGPDQARSQAQGGGMFSPPGVVGPTGDGTRDVQGGPRGPGGRRTAPLQPPLSNALAQADQQRAADAAVRARADDQQARALADQQARARAQGQAAVQAAAQANADRQAKLQAQAQADAAKQAESQRRAQVALEVQQRAHDQQVNAQAQAAAARQADAKAREQTLAAQRAQAEAIHAQDAARKAQLKVSQDQAAQQQAQAAVRAAGDRQAARQNAAAAQAATARAVAGRAPAQALAQVEAARAASAEGRVKHKPKPEDDHLKPGAVQQ